MPEAEEFQKQGRIIERYCSGGEPGIARKADFSVRLGSMGVYSDSLFSR